MSVVHPYRRPRTDVVRAQPWTLGDDTTELPEDLPDWDYDTVLPLRRTLVVEGVRSRKECGLDDDAELAVSVRWTASGSLLRGRAWSGLVPPTDGWELTAEFDLPGHDLGGTLTLDLALVLLSSGRTTSGIAPRRPGSVLWSDQRSVRLRGDATQFPIAVADFGMLPYPADAPWMLEINGGQENAALGSLLLLVNERRKSVVDAVTGRGSADPARTAAVLSMLRSDTLRGLVEHAVVDTDFDTTEEYPTGSTGAVLQAVLRQHLQDADLETLRREHNQDPAYFAARIQAAAGLLKEGA
jgi:hypothetical protein